MELTKSQTKIILLSIDGLGGVDHPEYDKTELEYAATPNLDQLAKISETGLITHVDFGVTPGSGPGHLALFGYPPEEYLIGRGVLSALGVGYKPKRNDIFFRGNLAIQDNNGILTDRRAGRVSTETTQKIMEILNKEIAQIGDIKVQFLPEKEHRFVLILNGEGLQTDITDTDPQVTGKPKLESGALTPGSSKTAEIINNVVSKIDTILPKYKLGPNTALFRGVSSLPNIPQFKDRYLLDKTLCIATYPMYKGLSTLVGMTIALSPDDEDLNHLATTFSNNYTNYEFFFIHVKKADSYGEDGNFLAKAKVIEQTDKVLIPVITAKQDCVVCVTGDHSTPAIMAAHSWHPVPVLIHSKFARRSLINSFSERECSKGNLGTFPAQHLMKLLLAHAQKTKKFGA
ncbi:MAG: 2,3-bisphosphoglycerate-independent phosphoglycerate mutase [Planctomycetes bacterium]|nr:2,3-bisphosphoglycerate-independent phosphoglycerate mutase [Planctomycetota bacterium]